jgi:hypothetical protein
VRGPSADAATSWIIIRRTPIGLALAPGAKPPADWPTLSDPSLRDQIALDDPRSSPAILALARGRLTTDGWTSGYAELVRLAANARPIGWRSGSALAAVRRGEAELAPVAGPDAPGVALIRPTPTLVEAAAIVKGCRHPETARAFLQALSPAPEQPEEVDAAAEPLLADLLGATLVDAQAELRTAWARLVQEGRLPHWEGWMVQAPPWPPASIATMVQKERARGRDPRPLVETLAEQVAPDPWARAWLLASWDRPQTPIDGALLAELARSAEGRLATEPRFRAWMRAEWTAWARQRYRRVDRQAGEPPPS